jgi:hypothetical protein
MGPHISRRPTNITTAQDRWRRANHDRKNGTVIGVSNVKGCHLAKECRHLVGRLLLVDVSGGKDII